MNDKKRSLLVAALLVCASGSLATASQIRNGTTMIDADLLESVELTPFSTEDFDRFYRDFPSEYADAMLKARMFDNVQEALKVAHSHMKAYFPDGVLTKGQHLFTIKDKRGPVGLLWYSESEPIHNRIEIAWFCYIYVEPEFRGKGYAKAAITKMEKHLKSIGIQQIGLNVMAYNLPAKRLYESLGYQVSKTVLVPDSDEVARYELSKKL